MKLKNLICLLLLPIVLNTATACSSQTNIEESTVSGGKANLKIYYIPDDKNMGGIFAGADITRARTKYMEKNKDKVTLDLKEFTIDQWEEYNNKITTELLAGEGPDIIVVNNYTFPNITKVMSTNVFCDLNELIKDDKEFKLTDYNEKVLEAGVYNGKRFFIPACYNIPTFYTTNEILEKNNIQIDENNWTWGSLAKIARDFKIRKNNISKTLFKDLNFANIIASTGDYFFDLKDKKSRFDSKEFINLLNDYKDIYSVTSKDFNYYDEDCVFSSAYSESPPRLQNLNAINNYYHKNDSSLKLYPFPSIDGKSGAVAIPQYSFAINSNCKNKKEAFNLLKMLISPYIQAYSDDADGCHIYNELPNNIQALNNNLMQYEGPQLLGTFQYIDKSGATINIPNIPLPQDLSKNLKTLIDGVDKCREYDDEIYSIVFREVEKNFINGKSTAEQAAKMINDKVNLYLNE